MVSVFERGYIAGPLTGTRLKPLPIVETTWKDWKQQHPNTLVLSPKTGYQRDYQFDPFEAGARSGTFQRSERVLGVIVEGRAKAYPFNQLEKVREFPLEDRVGNLIVLVYFEKKTKKVWITDESGGPVLAFLSYLHAWKTFYPQSEFFKAR